MDLKKRLSSIIIAEISLPIDIQFNRNGDDTILFQDDEGDDTEFYIYLVAAPRAEHIPYHGIRITKFERIESMINKIKEEIREFQRNLNDLH